MTGKRLSAFVMSLLAVGFWLSAGFYYTSGLVMIGMESIGVESRFAPMVGLAITLAGIAISIWALLLWSK